MTESEELKNNALLEEAKTKVAALGSYLDELTAKILVAEKAHKRSSRIYIVIWLIWVGLGFFSAGLSHLFTAFFIIALIYDQYCFSRMIGTLAEFQGAIKVLEILGYIPPRGDGERSSKKHLWEVGVEMVNKWKAKKKELQDKVFAPA